MRKPFISIVICTYNGERYLREQLNSLLWQTYSNYEILAVDDCSTDRSFDILMEYSKKAPLKAYQNEQNKGLNANFQEAITKATGDYIAICDQDDIWEPNKLETMIQHLDGSLLYYHDSAIMDKDGKFLSKKQSERFNLLSNPSALSFIPLNCVTGHACMFEKRMFDFPLLPFPKHIYYDNWLGFIAATNGKIKYIDECLVRYRLHESNIALSKKKKRKLDKKLLQISYEQLNSFYDFTPESSKNKRFIQSLRNTYQSNTILSAACRVLLFYRHWKALTAFRKKGTIRKLSFCFKMSYKPLPNYLK